MARSSFHRQDNQYLRFLISPGLKILDVGCGTGHTLTSLQPSHGVGVDLSPAMIEVARAGHPQWEYHLGDIELQDILAGITGTFDVILLHDTVGSLDDCQSTFSNLRRFCQPDTRIVIVYYNYLWEPVLRLADKLGLRMPAPDTNWLKPPDIINLLELTDYEVVRTDWRQLVPWDFWALAHSSIALSASAGIRRLCVRNYVVARPLGLPAEEKLSVTVVAPCRNERGNIEPILKRIPQFGDGSEILFIEGHSKDGTYEEVERPIPLYPHRDIKLLRQDGKGKGDAVFKAFAAAQGDVLMILDADISVPPEYLPKFYFALRSGKGEFINGSRLVYPMENAMRCAFSIASQIIHFPCCFPGCSTSALPIRCAGPRCCASGIMNASSRIVATLAISIRSAILI